MRWMPPTDRHLVCLTVVSEPIIGVIDDDDQHVGSRSVEGSFQVCAVGPDGTVLYNRALSRSRFAALLADQPACVVAMEVLVRRRITGVVWPRRAVTRSGWCRRST